MSNSDTETDRLNAASARFELTTVERAAVLRACREKRDHLRVSRDRLKDQAIRGDKHADSAALVLDAELSILEAAIRNLWRQSGCDPPLDV